jgi:5-methylcytosine-specific restriction endonuclease McrA
MAVFELYGNKCVGCGGKYKKPANQPHHIFPRSSYPAVKFDIENGAPLCNTCHFKLHFTEQKNDIEDNIKD